MSKFKGIRTFLVATLTVIVGALATIEDPNDWRAWAIMAVGALMAGLRSITDTPPGVGD